MSDSYLAISQIASDSWMTERMNAAITQQAQLGNAPLALVGRPADPLLWVRTNRYLWAASPTWGEKWDYALALHSEDSDYEPGKDSAVITDADIVSAIQFLASPANQGKAPTMTTTASKAKTAG